MMKKHDSQYSRHDRIYQAFFSAGVPLAGLKEGTKQVCHLTAQQSLLKDLYQVEAAMEAGLNLGAVTHQKEMPGINPLGFWDLDIDGPDHGLDLSPFTYRVRRRGESIKAHYLGRLPDPALPLVASYKGKDYDLCTWNTVLPGSIHKDGSVYELEFLEDGLWRQWDGEAFTLEMLPQVDPELYRTQGSEEGNAEVQRIVGARSAARKPKRVPVWVSATGTLATRTKMARAYLRYYAWKSISGKNGHDALLVAVSNLRLFFKLEEGFAIDLLKEHFNPRCVDLQGNPSPWSDAEIRHKWNEAGKPAAYPPLGATNPKAKQKESSIILAGEVTEFLALFTSEGGFSIPTQLREAFIAFRGGENVNETAFGRAVSKVTGIQTTKPNGVRLYRGFQMSEAGLGLTRKVREAA